MSHGGFYIVILPVSTTSPTRRDDSYILSRGGGHLHQPKAINTPPCIESAFTMFVVEAFVRHPGLSNKSKNPWDSIVSPLFNLYLKV